MPVALSDLVDEKHIAPQLSARTRANALREIVQLLAANEKIADPEKFVEQVLAREETSPGVIEHGVAFPHARTDLVSEIVLGIGRSRNGIPFDKTEQRARLIFVIGVPQQLISDYLVCVGALARLVKNDAVRKALLQAKTAREIADLLKKSP